LRPTSPPSSLENRRPIVSLETILFDEIQSALEQPRVRPLVFGLCGAQGSGKSTVARALAQKFPRAVALSLDDFYLTRGERTELARSVHPLLATRGVPGTHDTELACGVLTALLQGEAVPLPRFDKAKDNRADAACWPMAPEATELVIFEGWCVGVRPQPESELKRPVNWLEEEGDSDGVWRHYVNAQLAGPYQRLFSRIDRLTLLRAPNWEQVYGWRLQQEHELRRSGATGEGVMDDNEVRRFLSYYERLTRYILKEMPGRADLTLQLDADRRCVGIEKKRNP
jgi:D-glycerate 3-kinase